MADAKYKVRLDRSLAVDFELTCWEGDPPPGQSPEIIQIGIAEIDSESGGVLRHDSFLVKNVFSEVSAYCTGLTGITQRMLDRQGFPLSEAGRLLAKKYGTRNKPWLSWGSDKQAIDRDCDRKGVEPFFSNSFINAGLLYSIWNYDSRAIGLAEAAERFGVAYSGRQHDARFDAIVLAEVWTSIQRLVRPERTAEPGVPRP